MLEPKNKIQVKQGDTFGKLRIVGEVEPYIRKGSGVRLRQFLCYCDCGDWTYALLCKLREGRKRSCGCLESTGGRPRSEFKKVRIKKVKVKKERKKGHGMSKTRPYRIHRGLVRRIKDPKNKDYKHYGGRGLTMDKRWRTFEGFWEDMKEGYSDDLQIDRIDNEQGYYKWNCRWATPKQNARNSRLNNKYRGKSQIEWAEHFRVNRKTLEKRKRKLGSLRKAVQHYQRHNKQK